jgi:hypothetical protein
MTRQWLRADPTACRATNSQDTAENRGVYENVRLLPR